MEESIFDYIELHIECLFDKNSLLLSDFLAFLAQSAVGYLFSWIQLLLLKTKTLKRKEKKRKKTIKRDVSLLLVFF